MCRLSWNSAAMHVDLFSVCSPPVFLPSVMCGTLKGRIHGKDVIYLGTFRVRDDQVGRSMTWRDTGSDRAHVRILYSNPGNPADLWLKVASASVGNGRVESAWRKGSCECRWCHGGARFRRVVIPIRDMMLIGPRLFWSTSGERGHLFRCLYRCLFRAKEGCDPCLLLFDPFCTVNVRTGRMGKDLHRQKPLLGIGIMLRLNYFL
jgi:hypothetical protein